MTFSNPKIVKLCDRLQNDTKSRTIHEEKAVFSIRENGYIPTNISTMIILGYNGTNFITDFILTDIDARDVIRKAIDTRENMMCNASWKLYADFEKLKGTFYDQGGNRILIGSVKAAEDLGLVQDFKRGLVVNKEHMDKINAKTLDYADYRRFDISRDVKHCTPTDEIKYGKRSLTFLKTEGKRYTFGVEIETVKGRIPPFISSDLNMSAVFDGSLRLEDGEAHGAEYVTGVLSGDAGLVHLQKIVSEISKRCVINKLCSVHVHIGNVDFNQEFIVFMYKLAQILEAEIFSMMPKSRLNNAYCSKIKKLDLLVHQDSSYDISIKNNFEQIRNVINVVPTDQCNYKISKKHDHPLGYHCKYDKSTPRYWWLNFLPAMYNIRKNETYTLEFRCHSGTMNYRKIENWILIVMGIVNFVENHKDKIKEGLKLTDVIKLTYPKGHAALNKYIIMRQTLFNGHLVDSMAEQHEYTNQENANNNLSTKQIILTNE